MLLSSMKGSFALLSKSNLASWNMKIMSQWKAFKKSSYTLSLGNFWKFHKQQKEK